MSENGTQTEAKFERWAHVRIADVNSVAAGMVGTRGQVSARRFVGEWEYVITLPDRTQIGFYAEDEIEAA